MSSSLEKSLFATFNGKLDVPFLFMLDLRIFTTLVSALLVVYIYREISNKSIYPFNKKDLGCFALCFQGMILVKYTFLVSCLLFYPFSLASASNTILFSNKLYIALAIVDSIIFWILIRTPLDMKHSFSWKSYSVFLFYYIVYNLLAFFDIDIYRFQFSLYGSTILLIVLSIVSRFQSLIICEELNKFFGRKKNKSNFAMPKI